MKRLVIMGLCLCYLVGCANQFNLLQVDEVDKIEVMLATNLKGVPTEGIILGESDEVTQMMNIFRSGKLGKRVAERDLSLVQSSYYLLYKNDEVVQVISFNGNDSTRVWRGIECYEVKYHDTTPYEFIEELGLLNEE